MPPVRIGMASDLHLGELFGSRQTHELVCIMNQEKVDIILLPGDLIDDDNEAYRMEKYAAALAAAACAAGRVYHSGQP